jgi:N-acetylneuraminic acid mutarotase
MDTATHMRRVGVCLMLSALVVNCWAMPLGAAERGSRWSSLADMNAPHQYHACAAAAGKVFVVGGDGPKTLEEYSPQTDRWKVLPGLPTARAFLGVAAVGRKIYAVGGISRGRDVHDTVEVFDLDAAAWGRGVPLRIPRNRLAAVTLGGCVYAIGGMDARGNSAAVERLDPAKGVWCRTADMPTARHGHAAVVLGGRILVAGGYADRGPTSAVEEYDPATDRWTKRAPMLTARGFFGAAEVRGKVYAVGGRVRGQPPVERYDPAGDVWTRLDPMPGSMRNRFGIAVLGETIYVVGGELQEDRSLPTSALSYKPGDP